MFNYLKRKFDFLVKQQAVDVMLVFIRLKYLDVVQLYCTLP